MSDIRHLALRVLQSAAPEDKVKATQAMVEAWRLEPSLPHAQITLVVPDKPARPEHPLLMLPKHMPKRGYGGVQGRIALLHALTHIEFNAIDLACDILCRPWAEDLPLDFYTDWVHVALEESQHFVLLNGLLNQLDSGYGAMPAHDGLWQASEKTAHDLLARLAIVPLTLEARGLDTSPPGIERLRFHKDDITADALDLVYRDEIQHVARGVKWFIYFTTRHGLDPAYHYQQMLKLYFPSGLKPPFNDAARSEAGMPKSWYAFEAAA